VGNRAGTALGGSCLKNTQCIGLVMEGGCDP
jgi:hypothetical protein